MSDFTNARKGALFQAGWVSSALEQRSVQPVRKLTNFY